LLHNKIYAYDEYIQILFTLKAHFVLIIKNISNVSKLFHFSKYMTKCFYHACNLENMTYKIIFKNKKKQQHEKIQYYYSFHFLYLFIIFAHN